MLRFRRIARMPTLHAGWWIALALLVSLLLMLGG
jgi:hypothetical protein